MTLLIVEDEDIIRKGLIVTLRKLEMDFEPVSYTHLLVHGLKVLGKDHFYGILLQEAERFLSDNSLFRFR